MDIEPLLRLFEKSLLQEIGYGLLLDSEIESGEPVQPDSYYDYHLESGPVLVASHDAQAFVFKGSSLLALERGQLTGADVLRDAKRLMRSALNLYFGNKPSSRANSSWRQIKCRNHWINCRCRSGTVMASA